MWSTNSHLNLMNLSRSRSYRCSIIPSLFIIHLSNFIAHDFLCFIFSFFEKRVIDLSNKLLFFNRIYIGSVQCRILIPITIVKGWDKRYFFFLDFWLTLINSILISLLISLIHQLVLLHYTIYWFMKFTNAVFLL